MIDSVSGAGFRNVPTTPIGGVTKPAAAVPGTMSPDAVGGDFTALLGNAISEFSQKMRQAEAVSIGGVKGTVPLQDVVEHVMSAEQSLQAVIAVRDKVISAYQEISRMAI